MASHFTEQEWEAIESLLDSSPSDYGIPDRREGSVIIASWNIRKFGRFRDGATTAKTPGAFRMIERFCAQCDLIAIQEQQDDTESLYKLRDNLNLNGGKYEVVISDLTGRAPGRSGMAERMAWLYNTTRVKRGHLASDLTFDRSAVTQNINKALSTSIAAEIPPESHPGFMEKLKAWADYSTRLVGAKFSSFVQFIRSPHLVEFVIEGTNGKYEFYCVNAHLVSGSSKREREQEFFALLEWLLIDSKRTVNRDAKIYLLLGDLNLDFKSTLDKRRRGITRYITAINSTRHLNAKVNFPFLDGGYFTNARQTQTFDHIAWISDDVRLPRGHNNKQAGTLGPDQYNYGMFNFVRLFNDAGPARLPNGETDYDRFQHDLSDHMPIWVRLPIPSPTQTIFDD